MCPVIKIGILYLPSYEALFFLAVAITSAFGMAVRPKDFPLKAAAGLWLMIAYFVFQHYFGLLLHSLVYIDALNLSAAQILQRALIAYAIVLAASLFLFWLFYSKSKGLFLTIIDSGAGLCVLEHSIEKIGCLLTGCCRGTLSNSPWAIYLGDTLSRHPTQAYEMIAAFSIFAASFTYWHMRRYGGAVCFSVIILYAITRFINEFFRVGSRQLIGPLNVSHFAMIAMFAVGAAGLYFIAYRHASDKKDLIKHLTKMLLLFVMALLITGPIALSILSLIRAAHS